MYLAANGVVLVKRKLLIDPYDFDIDTYEDLERAELFLKKERIKAENYIINNDKEEQNKYDFNL